MSEKSSSNTKTFLILAAGLVVGFVVGFALANGINRQEGERLRGELARLKAGGAPQGSGGEAGDGSFPTLTDEQLRNAVARADASPADVELQKKVGQALYVYAWQTDRK